MIGHTDELNCTEVEAFINQTRTLEMQERHCIKKWASCKCHLERFVVI